jgi:hypothetical protein
MDKYERESLRKVTGKWLKQTYAELVKEDCGCAHIPFANTAHHEVCVCVGWSDDGRGSQAEGPHYSVAWKIGWQTFNNAMQTDLDIDFDMPWNTEAYCEKMNAQLKARGELSKYNRYVVGEVYDTEEFIELKPGRTTPVGYKDWNALAAFIRKTARDVAAYAKEVDPEEEE